jgi:very-short-patch-repair endonuclease
MNMKRPRRTAALRDQRRKRVLALAAEQEGVVSRRQVYAAGLTRAEVLANVRAGRWQRLLSQSIYVHTGPVPDAAFLWAAVFEAGPRAFLDGESALVAAGLTGYTTTTVRVSVPRGAKVRRGRGLNIRQTRRWAADDVVTTSGVPRTRPAVAAIRGALWAKTPRQGALLLTMAVQQGLVTAEQLALEMLRIRRDRRRAFVHGVLLDLLGGVRSLGELDFARECRQRGLPEPDRQVLRRGRNGRYYLDVYWDEWGVVVEIDGIQHAWAAQLVPDALRQNDITLAHALVLRLPLLGLRVAADDFFEQTEEALRSRGFPAPRRTA